jgi:hypothetical protein
MQVKLRSFIQVKSKKRNNPKQPWLQYLQSRITGIAAYDCINTNKTQQHGQAAPGGQTGKPASVTQAFVLHIVVNKPVHS